MNRYCSRSRSGYPQADSRSQNTSFWAAWRTIWTPTSGVLLVVIVAVISGCGGPKKPPQPAAQNANPPANVPKVAANADLPVAAAAQEKPQGDKPADGAGVEPPGPDDFVISTDQLVSQVEDPQPKPPPVPFVVTALPKGIDSTNLVIVAEGGTPAGSESSAYLQPGVVNPGAVNSANPMPAPRAPNSADLPRVSPAVGPTATTGNSALSLPKGFTAVAGSPVDAETGLPLRIHSDRDPVEMVLITPGVFLRGTDSADPNASPRHMVLMEQPYYIDTVEVSVGRYNTFREFFRKSEGKKLDGSINHDGNPDFPAVGIKFFDAKFYAKWTSKELPTESQWERAARGDRGHDFPWGEGRPIFHLPRVPGQLDPVGTYPADCGPFGVYDMSGSAREWCLDLFQADIYQKEIALGAGTVRNPVGPKSAPGIKQQVVRGGGNDWAVWHRMGIAQNETAPDIGFRCVLNLATSSKPKSDKPERPGTKKAEEKKGKTAL